MIKRNFRFSLVFISLFLPGLFTANSQVLVESILAIVGNEVIYLSDLENAVSDYRMSGDRTPVEQLRCGIAQQLLISKLFLDQARIDSIIVTDDVVEGELNMNMNDAIRRAGSEEALVEYFNKSMAEIRRDIKKSMLEQEIVRVVQSNIANNIVITPAALKRYYSSIPKDSLPIVPAKYQLSIIEINPPANEDNKAEARQKLLDIRRQILEGESSFNVQAIMYSEDPESAKNGGEIGFRTRGETEKEYSDAAFSLSMNTISRIVETRYGFHLIQLIDRKGEMVNTRHILIRPKVKPEQEIQALSKLDSLANSIRNGSISFADAAIQFSTHKDSKTNGGKFVSTNPSDRVTWFSLEELNTEMYVKVRDMNVGEISDPFRTTDENNNVVFRIVKLDKILPAHAANLKDDYQELATASLMNERSKVYEKWIEEKIETTYLRISDEIKSCSFLESGWLK